jgi:hypothetical protein
MTLVKENENERISLYLSSGEIRDCPGGIAPVGFLREAKSPELAVHKNSGPMSFLSRHAAIERAIEKQRSVPTDIDLTKAPATLGR